MPRRKSKSAYTLSPKSILIFVILAGLIAGGIFVVDKYQKSGIEQEGLIICNPNTCEKSLHVHAIVTASVCGETINFPHNTGDINQQHTHTQDNQIHFHHRLKLNPITYIVIDLSPLYLGNFFDNMSMRLTQSCLGDKCNGDACAPARPGQLTMTVNDQPNQLFDQYPWQDGDIINLNFE